MVAVLHAASGTSEPQSIAAWLAALRGSYPDDDLDSFEAAATYARERCRDQPGRDGEPLIDRAVGTAIILAGLKLDAATIRAALLIGLPAAHARSTPTRWRRASAPMPPRWSPGSRGWTRSACCRGPATPTSAPRSPSACARCCWRWWRTSAWC